MRPGCRIAGAAVLAGLAACSAPKPAETAAQLVAAPCAKVPDLALTGRVVDAGEMMRTADEQRVDRALQRYAATSGRQMVVVSVETLGGLDVDVYARCLGNRWGIGDRKRDDGILVLLAARERRVRLATGTGVQKILTDTAAQKIVDEMTQRFAAGDMGNGLEQGIAQIGAVVTAAASAPARVAGSR